MLRNRFAVALGFALVVGAFIAGPASAATVIAPCSGSCGMYTVNDQNNGPWGAVCKYETGSYDLDTIKVNPPKMYGLHSNKTAVQWKFNILRSTNSGISYTGIFNSSWQTGMASTSTAASFSSRTWTAPESPTGFFKVRLLLWWKNSGNGYSKIKVEYDYYQAKWNGNSGQRNDYCLQDW